MLLQRLKLIGRFTGQKRSNERERTNMVKQYFNHYQIPSISSVNTEPTIQFEAATRRSQKTHLSIEEKKITRETTSP